jgi:hypothetical protein
MTGNYLLDLVVLIVPSEYYDGRVVSNPLEVGYGLVLDRSKNFWEGRVIATTKHEVLPD